MATRIDRNDNYIRLTDLVTTVTDRYPSGGIYFRNEINDIIAFNHKFNHAHIRSYDWNDLRDENDAPWSDKATLIQWLEINTGGQQEIDAFLQDQSTPMVLTKMSIIDIASTLSSATSIDDMTVDLVDSTGFLVGQHFTIFSSVLNRFYIGNIISISVNTITLDTPLDFAFPIGSDVSGGRTNMAVDGSVTPVIFGVRNSAGTPIRVTGDITRIIIQVLTASAPAFNEFGDLGIPLLNGIVLRSRNGIYRNIFNLKTNGEVANLAFDIGVADAVNPNQGQNGYVARLTFAGQHKIGVVIRLPPGDDLELIVQDNLSSIQLIEISVQGHEVLD